MLNLLIQNGLIIDVYGNCALAQRDADIITEDRRLRNSLDQTEIRHMTLQMWAE